MIPDTHREYERERIEFMISREGVSGAISWAKEMIGVYRAAIKKNPIKPNAYRSAYRDRAIRSCLHLRHWVRTGELL